MVSNKNKPDIIAFVKRVCKEIKQPFTIFELTEEMCGQRRNFPTTTELQYLLTKMPFIEIVGKAKSYAGTVTRYQYVGD